MGSLTSTHAHTLTYTHACTRTRAHTHTHTHVRTCIHIHKHACTHTNKHTHTHTNTHTNTYMHTCTHTHSHRAHGTSIVWVIDCYDWWQWLIKTVALGVQTLQQQKNKGRGRVEGMDETSSWCPFLWKNFTSLSVCLFVYIAFLNHSFSDSANRIISHFKKQSIAVSHFLPLVHSSPPPPGPPPLHQPVFSFVVVFAVFLLLNLIGRSC